MEKEKTKKLRQQFNGKRNTYEVLVEKAKVLAPLLAITQIFCVNNYRMIDEEKLTNEKLTK